MIGKMGHGGTLNEFLNTYNIYCMKDRIRRIMELEGLTQQDYAMKLGISPASLSSIYTGRTNPTNNHVQAVHRAFPDVNISWLLFGEGEMLNSDLQDRHVSTHADGEDVDASEGENVGAQLASSGGSMGLFDALGTKESSSHTALSRSDKRSSPAMGSGRSSDAKTIDNIHRKIKEIRVFFDDGTYEAFVPSGK